MNNKEIMSRVAGCIYPYVRILNIDTTLQHKVSKNNMIGRLVDAEISSDDANTLIFTIDYSECNHYNEQFNDNFSHSKDVLYVNKRKHNFEIVNMTHIPNFARLKQIQHKIEIALKNMGESDAIYKSRILASSIAGVI